MQEYNDGSYGRIREGSELLKELADNPEELNNTRAVHFGSKEELLLKQMEQLRKQMEQLERKINKLMIYTGCADPNEILVID